MKGHICPPLQLPSQVIRIFCPQPATKLPLSPAPAPSHASSILARRGGPDSPLMLSSPGPWAPEAPLLLLDLAIIWTPPCHPSLCSFRPKCILCPSTSGHHPAQVPLRPLQECPLTTVVHTAGSLFPTLLSLKAYAPLWTSGLAPSCRGT